MSTPPRKHPQLVLQKEEDISPDRYHSAHPDADNELIDQYFVAIERCDLERVQECLQSGVPINTYDMSGRTIFHIAAANGSLALVKIVIDYPGIDLNIRSLDFMLTPLHEAVLAERDEIAEIYINAGAKINIPNGHGSTAIHMSVKTKSISIILLLIKHRINLNAVDIFCNTALSIAVLDLRDFEISQTLIKHGARVNKSRFHALYLFHGRLS